MTVKVEHVLHKDTIIIIKEKKIACINISGFNLHDAVSKRARVSGVEEVVCMRADDSL